MSSAAYADLAALVTFRPLSQPLVAQHKASPFSASWSSTVEILTKELRAHGAQQVVLEVDFREQDLRLDRLPRADRHARTPGVVLSFTATTVPGKPSLRYEVATFADWQSNVRAIALGLESLRAVDRHGVTKRGEQYAGWKVLASGATPMASAERGAEIVARFNGSLQRALFKTAPDTRDRSSQYTDADYRDVLAYKESR